MGFINQQSEKFQILDCTLRDGGYYTNWDFSPSLKQIYFENIEKLPIDFIEVGYRNLLYSEYKGEFYYTPESSLKYIKSLTRKKIAIILDEKSIDEAHLDELFISIQPYVDMVRLAIDPGKMHRVIPIAKRIKEMGFIFCLNIMYMSTWDKISGFFETLKEVAPFSDYIYLVDSFGSVLPQEIRSIVQKVRGISESKIGFHGHNNLELALANTLEAIQAGVDLVDATMTGMGRGAGNLKTELLLTVLNSQGTFKVDFDALAKIVQEFEELKEKHLWGTNLPYMISGANSLPQKEVMEWVSRRFYSFNSIVRALENKKEGVQDNLQLPDFIGKGENQIGVIIGGGPSAGNHAKALGEFLSKIENSVIIHASSKNAKYYKNCICPQYYCLVGNEGHRMEKVFDDWSDFTGKCILPPFPRKMGTYIPESVIGKTYQLKGITFTEKLADSHTVLALQTALELGLRDIYLVGYDGYEGQDLGELEKVLMEENEFSFAKFQESSGIVLISLTSTAYKNLRKTSVYALI